MCTVSWQRTPDGYELFFNRDELRTRQPAQPPALHILNGVRYLAPTDGDKGGTWLGVNEYGLTVGLLNRYADPFDRTRAYDSRGWLVRDALACKSLIEVSQFLTQQDLTRFPPFTLLALARWAEPIIWHWNGQTLWLEMDTAAALPLSSSSFLTAEVIAARRAYFRELAGDGPPDAAALRIFHHSHEPERGAYSVCMHRDDAQTVSLSHLKVTADKVSFTYHDGPPCLVKAVTDLTLDITYEKDPDYKSKGQPLWTAPDVGTIFKCPYCHETLHLGVSRCRFCKQPITSEEARQSAVYETTILQACSWANQLRTLKPYVFIVLGVWAYMLWFGWQWPEEKFWGKYLLVFSFASVVINCFAVVRWGLRYGAINVADEDFIKAQKTMRNDLHLWLALAASQIIIWYLWYY